MKTRMMMAALVAASALFTLNSQAQTPAAAAKITGVCKDGTPFEVETTKGACRGHGGIQKDASKASTKPAATAAAAPAATPAAAPVAATAPASKPTAAKPAPTATPAATPVQAAAGGGAGKVWLNDSTKVYHCSTDPKYGKTKQGEYLSEADAKAKGGRAARGKACS